MQRFRFSSPAISVAVRKSPIDNSEPGNPYTIFECICYHRGDKGPHKHYQITATSTAKAARMAFDNYRKDYGEESK